MYKNIVSSLHYGKVVSKKVIILLYVFLYISLIAPLLTIAMAIVASFGVFDWDYDLIIECVIANIFCVSEFVILCYILWYHQNLHKKIELWLEDAVETIAIAQWVTEFNLSKPFKVLFKFRIGDEEFEKVNSTSGIMMFYNKIFIKYDGKSVRILYSPKYDEVLILKDTQNP